jgi:hypothetical protein
MQEIEGIESDPILHINQRQYGQNWLPNMGFYRRVMGRSSKEARRTTKESTRPVGCTSTDAGRGKPDEGS